jgi:hypothetical protein
MHNAAGELILLLKLELGLNSTPHATAHASDCVALAHFQFSQMELLRFRMRFIRGKSPETNQLQQNSYTSHDIPVIATLSILNLTYDYDIV